MVGDRIEIDKLNGDVVEIRTRSTVIRTNDEVFLIVPNSKFITDTVTNWSFRSNRIRFRVPIGVASTSHPREVESALVAAAARCEGVLSEPPPSVYFRGFGNFTLEFELLCWTSRMLHKRPAFVSELNFAIWEELSQRKIEIPNPQRDLHIKTAEGLSFLRDGGISEPDLAEPSARNLHFREAEGAPMNRDELDGKKDNLAGRVKEAAGTLTGNKELETEGANQRAGGAVEEGLGRARRKVGEALEDLGDNIKR